ncbi:MAG TPA: hypothetical protein DHV69_01515 [Sphaerochaeta sp.]|nr:hypothetical protein [Sphaerochaeta sp.]
MSTIEKICVISNLFPPYPAETSGMFLYNLVVKFVQQGKTCVVIRPTSYSKSIFKKKPLPPLKEVVSIPGGEITIYSPRFFSVSSGHRLLLEFSYKTKERAVLRQYMRIGIQFDALYAHFFTSGRTAWAISKVYGVPFFTAHGESNFSAKFKYLGIRRIKEFYNRCNGIVAVSSHIRESILENYGLSQDKIVVEPNGTDLTLFRPMSKLEARKQVDIPEHELVVLFVGSLIERKGPRRLAKALEGLDHIHGYFIGKGQESIPDATGNIHLCGERKQSDVVTYMNAADMFVLPTLAEGSSNVIVEALACGLPIISSDRDFNTDILDNSCSILVDPTDIGQIREAILTLANNRELREEKALAALERGRQLDILERAKRILSFMEQHI